MPLSPFLDRLARNEELDPATVATAIQALVDEQVSAEAKADFLTQLARKGETLGEITAFARELRGRAVAPPIAPEVRERGLLDVCGTGGDQGGTFNISTTVALVAAAAGVMVAKHGNRAVTSKSGSADVLEELGIPVDQAPERAAESLRLHGFAFFFAPLYHPAFKHIGPARKICAARGQRTIFNFLGPLLNPARPQNQLVGVPHPKMCEPVARTLQALGVARGMVVSGRAGEGYLDELSILGDNTIAEFYHDRGFSVSTSSPTELGIAPASLADLAGGDRQQSAAAIRRILAGEERGPKRDAVLLNAGAALLVAGRVRSMMEGTELAASVLDSGAGAAKLAALASWR